ncbi:DHH family phosphoesterase [Neosynechococcus sphagnicola]|uniref:DHH family phosphoesterase n=1 Tax=Neosynechococcus sphagnicola TaxID=1501145 RepID=UPI000B02545C|nr:DHH family phosphoesterase [Neosynechococcus sphagnicola]
MPEQVPDWDIYSAVDPPPWFVAAVRHQTAVANPQAAMLLWQRGIQTNDQLQCFLDPDHYQPASPWEFGSEMQWAVDRLQQAVDQQQRVVIWGDFDADGLTATAVLWEGLGRFLEPDRCLSYFLPNRLTESHGLSCQGIDQLQTQGCQLIVTCDTGSTNLKEIAYARLMGIDVIITDHHTLSPERPPVTAILNPRSFPPTHPLAHLSGVAVAYKLIEALYEIRSMPPDALESLLDLVAIGLVADLVQMTGVLPLSCPARDCPIAETGKSIYHNATRGS